MPVALDREERAARARAALARAELRTGARSVLGIGGGVVGGVAADDEGRPVQPTASLLTSERPPMDVPAELAPVLPGGLRRGDTTVVTGSTSLVLTMLAHACRHGAWAAAVGRPDLGLLAAAQAGVDLARLAMVPDPGAQAATVVAALLDGIDVVVVGAAAVLTDTERRQLSARARERGTVLLPTCAWPGASTVLSVRELGWTGVGAGEGRLRSHRLRVQRSGRGGAAVPRSLDVVLPLGAPDPDGPVPVRSPALVPAGAGTEERTDLRLVG
ncbi:hypothetical protein [Cellulomonas sp. SG140]|uniref:hypothetical protein n=1 Tax=Cellulomonas sp. SG140 TaxID=2976536 RepID=UPI0021E7A860|nr:hypothetical protein [Cellulomonas sp. SG140]